MSTVKGNLEFKAIVNSHPAAKHECPAHRSNNKATKFSTYPRNISYKAMTEESSPNASVN